MCERERASAARYRGRANVAHARQPRPDSGLCFQVKVLQLFSVTTRWSPQVSEHPNFGGGMTRFAPNKALKSIA